jgi:hypothetical protein
MGAWLGLTFGEVSGGVEGILLGETVRMLGDIDGSEEGS